MKRLIESYHNRTMSISHLSLILHRHRWIFKSQSYELRDYSEFRRIPAKWKTSPTHGDANVASSSILARHFNDPSSGRPLSPLSTQSSPTGFERNNARSCVLANEILSRAWASRLIICIRDEQRAWSATTDQAGTHERPQEVPFSHGPCNHGLISPPPADK